MKRVSKVIINSDDFGYSRGINYGIIDAFQNGILTSTTLMTNTPGFEHAVQLKKENPKLGVGVHLTLTFGRPLRNDVPSLVNELGEFHPQSFYLDEQFIIDDNELYEEWDEQIKKVYQAGIEPTHLDSHHHVHTFGINQDVMIRLAQKYDLPVRGNFEKKDVVATTDFFEGFFDNVGEVELERKHVDRYIDQLVNRLKRYRSVEIMCHTGYVDQFLLEHTSFYQPRIYQTDFLIHSEFAKKMREDEEIELIHYGDW